MNRGDQPESPSSGKVDARQNARTGVAFGVAAYLWWGLVPIYFKAVAHVPETEVLAHRIIWSTVLLAALMCWFGRWPVALASLKSRKTMVTLGATTVLIAVNWFMFIWAVANDHLLEASLGYFINPLLNVLLGVVFLRERLRPWQIVSVIIAAIGVSYRTFELGELPVVSLVLAGTFGMYGLLRKTAPVDALTGLTVETALLLPLAVGYAVFITIDDRASFCTVSVGTSVLLAMGGVVTAVPLLWFTNAARRLRLSTLGFLQYIAPTLQFLLAVIVFGEPFHRAQLVSFGCIWIALAIYSADAVLSSRSGKT